MGGKRVFFIFLVKNPKPIIWQIVSLMEKFSFFRKWENINVSYLHKFNKIIHPKAW